jgi:hypothetical protein
MYRFLERMGRATFWTIYQELVWSPCCGMGKPAAGKVSVWVLWKPFGGNTKPKLSNVAKKT